MNTAIIIGSGFGGLALAARLQGEGFQVTVLEKNDQIGGHASQLKKNGFTFDMGPSIITAESTINAIFKQAGRSLREYVPLVALDPYYRVYFHDDTFIDYSGDARQMKKQISVFNPQDAERYDDFLSYSKEVYEEVIEKGLGSNSFDSWLDLLSFMPTAIKKQLFLSNTSIVNRYFQDFRTRFLFSFHPLFLGGNPFNTPAIYSMIPYLETTEGVLYAEGGMYSLVKAFGTLITELGGEIRTNAPVTSIIVEDGEAKGVVVNGKKMLADVVVSNAHSAHTYQDLIDPQYRKVWTDRKVESSDYSMSCVVLYIGTYQTYPKLLHHTIILSARYKELVNEIFRHTTLPDDFSIYAHAPSRTDPTMAPSGGDSLYLLIPTPNLKADIDWSVHIQPFTEKILAFLEEDFGLTDFRKHINVLEWFTPEDFQNVRNNYLGACWSLEPKLTQVANFRPHNRSEDVKHLYLVGASTHPGAGVPGVLLSAEATEKDIREDFRS